MSEKVILVDRNSVPNIEKNFLIINTIEIKDKDTLLIRILFHGGCKDHLFKLIGFFDDDTNILNLILDHNANDDQCKMVVKQDLTFDLSTVKNNLTIRNKIRGNFLILKLESLELKYHIV